MAKKSNGKVTTEKVIKAEATGKALAAKAAGGTAPRGRHSSSSTVRRLRPAGPSLIKRISGT